MANRDIITRTGAGVELTAAQHDQNHNSFARTTELHTGTSYTLVYTDQNKVKEFSNASPVAVTLSPIATIIAAIDTDSFYVTLLNIGVGTVTVTCGGADAFFAGGTSVDLAQFESMVIHIDSTGTKWNQFDNTSRAVFEAKTQTLTNKTVNGGTVHAETVVSTAATASADFTGIPSWAKKISILIDEVSSTTNANLLVRIGDSGGFETTGYISRSAINVGTDYGNTTAYAIGGGGTVSASNNMTGIVELMNITGNRWVMKAILNDTSASGNGFSSSGVKTLTGTLDRVSVFNATGTLDNGQINILYEG